MINHRDTETQRNFLSVHSIDVHVFPISRSSSSVFFGFETSVSLCLCG